MSNPYNMQQPVSPKQDDTRPLYKRKRVWIPAVAALLIIGGAVGNGGSDDGTKASSPAPVATVTETAPAAEAPAPADDAKDVAATKSPEGDSGTGVLPNMVGKNLQAAQDGAQAAGFWMLDDQDASGQGRLQVFDRNWKVCSQEPAPGTHTLDTPVTFYAVKYGESC
jgi:hypothetical protein